MSKKYDFELKKALIFSRNLYHCIYNNSHHICKLIDIKYIDSFDKKVKMMAECPCVENPIIIFLSTKLNKYVAVYPFNYIINFSDYINDDKINSRIVCDKIISLYEWMKTYNVFNFNMNIKMFYLDYNTNTPRIYDIETFYRGVCDNKIDEEFYKPPECLNDYKIRYIESNLWQIGCILYEFLFSKKAFKGVTILDTKKKIIDNDFDKFLLNEKEIQYFSTIFSPLEKRRRLLISDIYSKKLF